MIKDVEQQFKVPFVFAFPEDYNPFNIMVQNKASAILVSLLLGISSDAEPFFLPPPFPVIFVSSQLNHQKPQKERCYADLSILVWLEYGHSPLSLLVLIFSFVLGLK